MNAENSTDPVQAHRAVLRVISGIILCLLLAAFDQTVVIPAIPAISREFETTSHLAWILTSYLLTSTIVAPIYGKLSDLHGRRLILMIALSLFIAASLACGFATSVIQLSAFRALQGIGGGGLLSLSQAAIADAVSPRERGRYQGYLAGAWGSASVAGPLVGGWVAEYLSWRWLFWINLPIGLLAIALCYRGLPARTTYLERPVRFDLIGSALLTVGVTLLLLALTLGGQSYPWLSTQIVSMMFVAVIVLAALALQQRQRVDGVLPARLFADAALRNGSCVSFFTAASIFTSLFTLPLMLQHVYELDAAVSGTLIIPFMATQVYGSFTGGRLAGRLGHIRPMLLGGSLLASVVFGAMALLAPYVSYAFLIGLSAFAGLGLGFCMVGTLLTVQNAALPRDMGAATGGLLLLRAVGSIGGSAVAGAFIDTGIAATGPSHSPIAAFLPIFILCAGMMGAALVLSLTMPSVVLRGGPTSQSIE